VLQLETKAQAQQSIADKMSQSTRIYALKQGGQPMVWGRQNNIKLG